MALRVDDVDLARDRTLVERFQLGDEGAFEELYRRYFDRLERFCRKRVNDPSEAEELAQEAFARAYRALPAFAGERRFYPWVSVIAARLCVDSHRRRSRSEPSADIDLGSVDGGQDDVVDQVDVELLGLALERLSPRHREALLLREREGWSYQRMAEHLDVSLGTVETVLFRARKALRREFFALQDPEERRRGVLLGLPVAAWLSRRLASARARFGPLLDQGMPQAAAGGLAVAAIGGAALVGVTQVGHAPPHASQPVAAAAAPGAAVDLPATSAATAATAPNGSSSPSAPAATAASTTGGQASTSASPAGTRTIHAPAGAKLERSPDGSAPEGSATAANVGGLHVAGSAEYVASAVRDATTFSSSTSTDLAKKVHP